MVLLFACVSSAAAQADPGPSPSRRPRMPRPRAAQPGDEPAQPAPEAEPEKPLTPEEAAGFEAVEAAEAAAEKTADVTGFRERELRAKLEVAKREEQEASTLLPWVTTIMGWSSVLAGTVIGAAP